MRSEIHREGLMFDWITKNHKIIVGFKKINCGKCNNCGKAIPLGNSICDECFKKEKKISKK